MAEKLITRIRTTEGDLQIDYSAIANPPAIDASLTKSGAAADAKAVRDQIDSINNRITEIVTGDALAGITINGKDISDSPVLTAADVGASEIGHKHSASDVTSGTLSMERGGTNADNGSDGLKNLLAAGPMVLSTNQYITQAQFNVIKEQGTGTEGQILFVKVQS